MAHSIKDRRVERSRAAILEAFRLLFFEHGFDGFDVSEVAVRGNVGRSTFYKHFRNKEDLLIQSLRPFLEKLADACVSDDEPEGLSFVPEHFWEKRGYARVVFSGRSMTLIVQSLAETIEERLSSLSSSAQFALPVRLVAAQVAASQMTLLDEWLRGRGTATPLQITSALHRSSRAIIRDLVLRPRV
jgi:AcrR family transcriptional regulator